MIHRAAILAVGSELLTPSRIDTNSLAITEQLDRLGIAVACKAVVGDDRDELAAAVRTALGRVDLLVCCGGLGPTDDDLTREVVASVMGKPLSEDARIVSRIEARFAARGIAMPAINRRQAMVPQGASVLDNANGTAPGLWIEDGAHCVLLLPGPPRELKPMLASCVESFLAPRASGVSLQRRVVRITNRTESQTDETLQPLYARWARQAVPVAATILASLGQIELHVSARAASRTDAQRAVDEAAREIGEVLGDDVFSLDGRLLEEVVGDLLVTGGFRIAVAESCTGGLLTSRLTDIAGSSRYVECGVVAYANAAKVSLLGVSESLIAVEGAVSEPVAVAMAEGVRKGAGVEVGIGVTGIAGPGGGSATKPVGTVAVAVAIPGETGSRTFRFVGDREQVKYQASQAALDMTRRMLLARPRS
ncbi:MAG: competence/damage-inducible protein A [Acidobacteria bacterium]|nr:competence/damage-inducible protein A [Acidobacteriota bacterium]